MHSKKDVKGQHLGWGLLNHFWWLSEQQRLVRLKGSRCSRVRQRGWPAVDHLFTVPWHSPILSPGRSRVLLGLLEPTEDQYPLCSRSKHIRATDSVYDIWHHLHQSPSEGTIEAISFWLNDFLFLVSGGLLQWLVSLISMSPQSWKKCFWSLALVHTLKKKKVPLPKASG